MSNAKHTPGPWVTTPEPNGIEWGVDAGKWGIATCAAEPGDGTTEANARLIASAPDLLAALSDLLAIEGLEGDRRFALNKAFSAIAKARGE